MISCNGVRIILVDLLDFFLGAGMVLCAELVLPLVTGLGAKCSAVLLLPASTTAVECVWRVLLHQQSIMSLEKLLKIL